MAKCSVRSTRKRSAGSNTCAPGRAAALVTTSALTSSRLMTRRTRKHDAEDERGNPEQSAPDEEEGVAFEERPAGGEVLDHHTRKPLREFPDVGVRGAQKRV